jgi:hypothetical protein
MCPLARGMRKLANRTVSLSPKPHYFPCSGPKPVQRMTGPSFPTPLAPPHFTPDPPETDMGPLVGKWGLR